MLPVFPACVLLNECLLALLLVPLIGTSDWAPLLRGYALSLLRLLCFVKLSAASFSKPIFASEPS